MASEDISSLRQPISLSKSDALQLWSALKTGTEEIRNVLINECKIIMECKLCNSLFRGLPNFVAHKRIYCTEACGKQPLLMSSVNEELETVFLEPTNPDEDDFVPKPAQFYADVKARIADKQLMKSEARVQLLRIDENKNAMSQRVVTVNSKTDICEVESTTSDPNVVVIEPKAADGPLFMDLRNFNMLPASPAKPCKTAPSACSNSGTTPEKKSSTILEKKSNITPEKKKGCNRKNTTPMKLNCKDVHKLHVSLLSRFKFCDMTNLKCKKCSISYQSFRSLRRHMFSKHIDKKKTFLCQKCDAAFLKIWNLTRHMMQVHKLSPKEVDTFRKKHCCNFTDPHSMLNKLDEERKLMKKTPEKVATKEQQAKAGCTKPVSGPSKGAASQPNTSITIKPVPKIASAPGKGTVSQPSTLIEPAPKMVSAPTQVITLDLSLKKENGTSAPIKFTKGFTLLKCSCCNKIFGKKEAYTKHVSSCDEDISFKNSSTISMSSDEASNASNASGKFSVNSDSDSENTQPSAVKTDDSGSSKKPTTEEKSLKNTEVQKVENGNVEVPVSQKGSMEKFQRHLYMLRFSNHQKLSDERMHQLMKIIDEEQHKCLQCGMVFANNSSIHRHAIRHMGWKRFKCKLCAYTAFNRSDVNTHLKRVHVARTTGKDLNKFMINLDDEPEKPNDVKSSKTETKATNMTTTIPKSTASRSTKTESPSPQKREGRVLRDTSSSRDRSRSTSSNSRSKPRASTTKTSPVSGNSIKSDYNISTRRIPRTFDLRPCRSSSLPPSGRTFSSGNHCALGTGDRKRSLPDGSNDSARPAKMKRIE